MIAAGTGAGGGLARPFASGLGGGLSGGASLGAASRGLARGCLLAGFGGGPFELPKTVSFNRIRLFSITSYIRNSPSIVDTVLQE